MKEIDNGREDDARPVEPRPGTREGLERRRLRNNLIIAVCSVAAVALIAGIVVLLAMSGGGRKVPGVIGLAYSEATKKVEAAGLNIEIDRMQDSSGDYSRLKVETQDPKAGTTADQNEVVTVRLKGLHDSPEMTRDFSNAPTTEPAASQPGQQPAAQAPAPVASARTVCIDPGHSGHDGNEIDPATGLNVGDNGGASGELQNMWDLAQKVKARLEQAGYVVRLTKGSASDYDSLRTRADIGNDCDLVVRLHYDDTGFTGVMRPPPNAARCPVSDPSRVTVVDASVASASNRLASDLAAALGLSVRDDTGGTSQGNGTPPGHPTALIGSVLSHVPVVCIENRMGLVRDNPSGQEQVAGQILEGVNAYFQDR